MQLDIEKDKNRQFMERIAQKDELLEEMSKLQGDLYKQIDKLQGELGNMKQKQDNFAILESQISTLNNNIQLLEAELQQKDNIIRVRQEENFRLQDDLDFMKQEYEKLQIQIENKKIEDKNKMNQLSDKDEIINTLQENIQMLQREVKEKEDDLQRLITHQGNLKYESENFKQNQSTQSKEIKHLQQEKDQFQKDLVQLKKEQMVKDKEIIKLQEKLEVYQNELQNQKIEYKQNIQKYDSEVQSLKEQLSKQQLSIKHDQKYSSKELTVLREENEKQRNIIYQLSTENQQLKKDAEEKQSFRSNVNNESRVDQLEKQVQELIKMQKYCTLNERPSRRNQSKSPADSSSQKGIKKSKSRSTSNIRNRDNSTSRDPPQKQVSKDRQKVLSYQTLKSLLDEIVQELEVKLYSEIISTIRNNKECLKSLASAKKFIQRVSELVVDCSPPESFKKGPTVKQMWKWQRRLVEEYMQLKTNQADFSLYKSIIYKVMSIIGINEVDQVETKVQKTLHMQAQYKQIVNKCKTLYKMKNDAGLVDLERHLDKMIDTNY